MAAAVTHDDVTEVAEDENEEDVLALAELKRRVPVDATVVLVVVVDDATAVAIDAVGVDDSHRRPMR